jgi:DNA-directed RNA polymerase beta subunit
MNSKDVQRYLQFDPLHPHIEQFNNYITNHLPSIVKNQLDFDVTNGDMTYRTEILNVYIVKQFQTPVQAHLYDNNYAFDVDIDYKVSILNGGVVEDETVVRRYTLFSHSVMLQSNTCVMSSVYYAKNYEYGGDFILRGNRRYIPMSEHLKHNMTYIYRHPKTDELVAEFRPEHPNDRFRSTSTSYIMLKKDKYPLFTCKTDDSVINLVNSYDKKVGKMFYMKLSYCKKLFPLRIILYALKYTPEDFVRLIYRINTKIDREVLDRYMQRILLFTFDCYDHDNAVQYIYKMWPNKLNNETKDNVYKSIMNTINAQIYPNVNDHPDRELLKVMIVAKHVYELICVTHGVIPMDKYNRDNYKHISVDVASDRIATLLRQRTYDYRESIIYRARGTLMSGKKRKRIEQVNVFHTPEKLFTNKLTSCILSAMATGKWSDDVLGVTHPMKTTNKQCIFSQLRRVNNSCFKLRGRHIGARQKNGDSFGYTCAAETPDGEDCGLVYTMALTSIVSSDSIDDKMYYDILMSNFGDLIVSLSDESVDARSFKLIDHVGAWIGWVVDVNEFTKRFRELRVCGVLKYTDSISVCDITNDIWIQNSNGRYLRPLLVLKNLYKLYDVWNAYKYTSLLKYKLLSEGIIEYLDTSEIQTSYVHLYHNLSDSGCQENGTHIELSHNAFVGLVTAQIPFFNHNQGPRPIYYTTMKKQCLSYNAPENYGFSTLFKLNYGETPIVSTNVEYFDSKDGQNLMMAIFAERDTQEDSFSVNKRVIDFGFLSAQTVHMYTSTLTNRNGVNKDIFERPNTDNCVNIKSCDYSKIDSVGMPILRASVREGDPIIGKTIPAQGAKSKSVHMSRVDASTCALKDDDCSIVSKVIRTNNMIKVFLMKQCPVSLGDKLCNRHGQKGTVGAIKQNEDMIFAERTGMVPDIVIGATSIPSRMTMGMLIEMLVGKAAVLSNDPLLGIDEQTFERFSESERCACLKNVLLKYGYNSSGTERFRSGVTGELLECDIMFGPMYYNRLTHMSARKINVRSRGPIDPMTRQPPEGRRNMGGLRLGMMDLDVAVSHGASRMITERVTDVSDPITVYICKDCKYVVPANTTIGLYLCKCGKDESIRKVKMSHSSLLMFYEMMSTGIDIQFILSDDV